MTEQHTTDDHLTLFNISNDLIQIHFIFGSSIHGVFKDGRSNCTTSSWMAASWPMVWRERRNRRRKK